MAAAVTQAVIAVDGSYVSLGTTQAGSGMLVTPEGEIMIVAASSLPPAATVGHPLGLLTNPFYFPFFATQVWATAASANRAPVSVSVTF